MLPHYSSSPRLLHICPHGKICLWIMRLKFIQTSKPIYMGKIVFTTYLFTHLRHSCNRLLIASQICKLSPIHFAWANAYWKLTRCSAEKSMPSGAKVCGFKFRYCQFDVNFKNHLFSFLTRKNVRNSDTAHHKTVVSMKLFLPWKELSTLSGRQRSAQPQIAITINAVTFF